MRADNRIALVGEAEDVTSGLQLLAESVPALVVLNVSEGGATALVGLCELKTHYPQVRFVALVRDHAQEQQAHVADIDAVRANGFTSEMLFRSPR
ncbi:MAG: hypothetical protein HY782_00960 [Chloroflexi bacterium]|nr:hypothetical protein [Chloroflexota bacterium]